MESKWIFTTKNNLPPNGTIVEIKIAADHCRCAPSQTRETYFDNGQFAGVASRYVDYWRISPANDLIKEIDSRKNVIAKDCTMCK